MICFTVWFKYKKLWYINSWFYFDMSNNVIHSVFLLSQGVCQILAIITKDFCWFYLDFNSWLQCYYCTV